MEKKIDEDWLRGRASLGAASGWAPEEMRLVADLGFALAEQGRDEEAIEVFAGLAALAPATAYFQAALGALKLRTGAYAEALEHLNAALKADPSDTAALTNRGEAHLLMENRIAAADDLRAVLALEKAHGSAHAVRARALLVSMGGVLP